MGFWAAGFGDVDEELFVMMTGRRWIKRGHGKRGVRHRGIIVIGVRCWREACVGMKYYFVDPRGVE